MKHRVKLAVAVGIVAAGAVIGTVAVAGDSGEIREQLTGYEETPLALSTPGEGKFTARIDRKDQKISYRLRYADLEAPVTQAHIHLGARAQTGGISAFLCTNLGNGPAGTQACPAQPATITGTIRPADVIGPSGQGIAAGEFGEFVDAIAAGATYVNVHTEKYGGGEVRAQIERGKRGDSDD
jgi:CHRD domain